MNGVNACFASARGSAYAQAAGSAGIFLALWLRVGYTETMNRILYYFQNPLQLLYMLPAVLLGLTFHEWGHAYAAYRLGDPTAKNMGRLSLNPLDHFDPLGVLCMLLLGFGWAKPVPVNYRNFKNFRRDNIIVSLAGVTMNVLIVLVFSGLFVLLARSNYALLYNEAFVNIFFNIISMNTCLCVFNLIPIPPLDGSKVLAMFLPNSAYGQLMRYERYGILVLLALSWLGLGGNFLGNAIYGVYEALFHIFFA